MSLINITPSTGERRPVSINLNALKVKPGDRVVYWSAADGRVMGGNVQGYASGDGNAFAIEGENVFVTFIYAKLRPDMPPSAEALIVADFAAFGRQIITGFERMTVRDRHGL